MAAAAAAFCTTPSFSTCVGKDRSVTFNSDKRSQYVPAFHSASSSFSPVKPGVVFLQRNARLVRVQATADDPPATSVVLWTQKREVLLKNNVRSVSPKSAAELVKEGYVLLDVRPVDEFNKYHAEGAKNTQVYRLIKNWSPRDIARRLGFAFFGVFNGTEENPEFLYEVASTVSKDDKIIVSCSPGGSLRPTASFPGGKESRSLIAAYILVTNGYSNVLHLEGGLAEWVRAGLPVEEEE